MEQRLEKIQLGIKRLQELHQESVNEINLLKAQNTALQNQVLECEKKSAETVGQNILEGIANGTTQNDVEKKQMKLKINELVREVDKCIALLNQ